MEKSTEKKFGYFWVIGGLIWAGAGLRHLLVKEDLVGALIEFAAVALCLILAYNFFASSKSK